MCQCRSRGDRRYSRILAGVAVTTAIAACDPVAAVTVKSALRTAPMSDCMQRALAQSSLIDSVRPADHRVSPEGTLMARLRNPRVVDVLSPWVAIGVAQRAKDSTELKVTFQLPGRPTWAVDDEDSHLLAEIGRAIADDVVTACAPTSTARFSCRVSGMFWTKGCGRG